MNLSRISLTKYLGCFFVRPREATSKLETKAIDNRHWLRDLDPFAFELQRALSHCNKHMPQKCDNQDENSTPCPCQPPASRGTGTDCQADLPVHPQCDNPPL